MSALRKAEASLVEGEFAFTQSDFRHIADILYADSGIHLIDAKAPLVYSRLGKRLRQLGLSRFSDYCRLLEGPDGAGERASLLSAQTTNVTRFFREPHHFDALKKHQTSAPPQHQKLVKQALAVDIGPRARHG